MKASGHSQLAQTIDASISVTCDQCRELKIGAADTYNVGLISLLIYFSRCLRDVDKKDEASVVENCAAMLSESLSTLVPDTPSLYLSLSLSELANDLSGIGRIVEAIAISEMDVAICIQLVANTPGKFDEDLVRSMEKLSFHLKIGRAHV